MSAKRSVSVLRRHSHGARLAAEPTCSAWSYLHGHLGREEGRSGRGLRQKKL